jgi:pimeloyl-ACP methyl ester carboxylesterase
MPQHLYEFGGQGSILHLAVANGFPPQTYRPLLAPLTATYRVVSLPPRPLWPDAPPPHSLRSWSDMADDLLAGLRAHHFGQVIAVGHSFGGIASLVAAARDPQRFRALILLDPTIFEPSAMFALGLMKVFSLQTRMPLVRGALNRRARFASLDEAYAYWRGKRLFADWPDEALRLYAESMTRPAADGNGLELTWSPAWEARGYQTVLTTTWRSVRALRGALPILLVRGGRSDTLLPATAARLRRTLPNLDDAEVDGHGHLFPQTAPDATRALITDWLRGLPGLASG